MRPVLALTFLVAASLLGGCGGSTSEDAAPGAAGAGGSADAGEPDAPAAPTIPWACHGAVVTQGQNEAFSAGGFDRAFSAKFPGDTSRPWGVVFQWHGYGDTADNFDAAIGIDPDTDPELPLVVITPEDTNLTPFGQPYGLDFQIFDGAASSANRETALVEEIVACLAVDHPVDPKHLHSVGFSAGAIMSNLLHSRYQGVFASTAAYSGAWFNDAAEVATVNTVGAPIQFEWEPLDASKPATVLLTHGGAADAFGVGPVKVMDFGKAFALALPFLQANGRTVVECAHKGAHQPHPGVGPVEAVAFFKAHPLGAPSPWTVGEPPPDFPSTCTTR